MRELRWMGVDSKNLQLIVSLGEQRYIKRNGRILELGAQQLSNSVLRSAELVRRAEIIFGATHRMTLPTLRPTVLSPGMVELLDNDAPPARDFWISLGFDYASIDLDKSPGSIPLDLNYEQVPSALRNKYDLITNFGTTEHICNQMNAFRAIHDLAAPGAVLIHHVPAGGHLNHGLFSYNLKFFWCLSRCNDYTWLHCDFYGGEAPYGFPKNILNAVESHVPASAERMKQRTMSDYDMLIAVQKTIDTPFVPPLESDAAARISDAAMKRRYWSVFHPDIIESVRRGESLPKWISQSTAEEPNGTQHTDAASNLCVPAAAENAATGSGREDYIPSAADKALSRSEERMRQAMARIPGRRFVAFVAAVSALSTAIIMAAILIGVRLLFF